MFKDAMFPNFIDYYRIGKSHSEKHFHLDIHPANFSNRHTQTLHWSAHCFFEVQGGLSGKTSSEINSAEAGDANRMPSTARNLKNVE